MCGSKDEEGRSIFDSICTFSPRIETIYFVEEEKNNVPTFDFFAGEQAMSKALVASRLCQAMAHEAADDDLDVEIFDELTNFGEEFDDLGETEEDLKRGVGERRFMIASILFSPALQLLDHCYHLDDDLTQHLLTASLDNWSRKTCLSLAIVSRNLKWVKTCFCGERKISGSPCLSLSLSTGSWRTRSRRPSWPTCGWAGCACARTPSSRSSSASSSRPPSSSWSSRPGRSWSSCRRRRRSYRLWDGVGWVRGFICSVEKKSKGCGFAFTAGEKLGKTFVGFPAEIKRSLLLQLRYFPDQTAVTAISLPFGPSS